MFKKKHHSDPAFALAELRSAIEHAIEKARASAVRGYQIVEALEAAARVIRIKDAATQPIL